MIRNMTESMNSYWFDNGKHQDTADQLYRLKPDWGMTENKYMNLFLCASNVYYDVYNNGGCNLNDNYPKKIEEYLFPFAEELKSLRFDVKMDTLIRNFKNKKKLEAFLDEIFMYLQDKDLSYEKHIVFFDNVREELSKEEKEGFSQIVFGNEADCISWINYRINSWNFKWVS